MADRLTSIHYAGPSVPRPPTQRAPAPIHGRLAWGLASLAAAVATVIGVAAAIAFGADLGPAVAPVGLGPLIGLACGITGSAGHGSREGGHGSREGGHGSREGGAAVFGVALNLLLLLPCLVPAGLIVLGWLLR